MRWPLMMEVEERWAGCGWTKCYNVSTYEITIKDNQLRMVTEM